MNRCLVPVARWIAPVILFLVPLLLTAQPDPFFDGPPRLPLGGVVNSPAVEIIPVVSPDGKTLYFDRKYDSANVGGVDDEDDIYYSTLGPDGVWSAARNIGPPLNTKGSDVLFWISSDQTVALVYNGDLARKGSGLGIARKTNGTWGHPQAITIEGADLGSTYYATITPDMRRLIVALQPDSTNEENLDLYYVPAASLDLLRWGAPVSLGSGINTTFFEGAPFMASDNRTLYFSSAGLSGMGSADIYMTRRIGEGWNNWSDPINLGPRVNTPAFDASMSIPTGGEVAYISSMSNVGNTDIFGVALPKEHLPQRLVVLHGTFRANGTGVSGLVRAVRLPGRSEVGSTVSATDGTFTLFLPPGVEYSVVGWSQEHGEATTPVDCRTGDMERRVELSISRATASEGEAATGLKLTIDGFTVGSDEIPAEGAPQLEVLYNHLRERGFTNVAVSVVGHTDNKGEHTNNQGLSDRRAGAVLRWLVIKGVPPNLVSVSGVGESRPVTSNEGESERGRNRRVEITVTVTGRGG